MQKHGQVKGQYQGETPLKYLLHLPENYRLESDEKWPLILFLHGRDESGSDLERVKTQGIPKEIEAIGDFPFIVVSPQCSENSYWTEELEPLNNLLNEIQSEHHVDPSRIYLTGLSMGGFGTWHLAAKSPERFAAIAPVCGGGDVGMAERLKNIPIWAFHGDEDHVVPLRRSLEMVEAVEEQGGQVLLTIYEGVGHDSWTDTFENPKLYEWFLQHSKDGG